MYPNIQPQVPIGVVVPSNSDVNTEDNNSRMLEDEDRRNVPDNYSESAPLTEEEIWNQPGPSWSGNREEPTVVFSPEIVRPFPKAPPRVGNSKRRIRKSTVLTDTPEKEALAAEQSKKKKKTIEKTSKDQGKDKGKEKQQDKRKWKGKGKGKGKSVKRQVLQSENESSDEEVSLEYYCIMCCDSYSNSRPGEEWVQCQECPNWAHSKCLKKSYSVTYVCPNCGSDASCDDL